MQQERQHPVVLEYATPLASGEVPYLKKMRQWQAIAGYSLVGMLFGPMVYRLIAPMAMLSFVLASVMTFIYMTRAAASEVGVKYAVRQLSIALVLLPLLGLGVLVVPSAVESDLIKWREKQTARSADETRSDEFSRKGAS